mmetsp:Transcript_19367/g.23905  ORF Transcript_19367/g.23905 Transcript_19367/m.23905 type:complete len:104 (+) Transcript_19367:621-932(+)
MKTTSTAFVPTPVQPQPQLVIYEEPSYKQKEKTELCKYWCETGHCKFGNMCAFAHGEHELQKKTHVATKYRMKPCTAYQEGYCIYGRRCQFLHTEIDFTDFES